MELELSSWFVNRNHLGSIYVEGEIERQTDKAVLFDGVAVVKPSTICCKCGRILTDPVSIQLGIGPFCAGIDQRDSMSQEDKDEYVRKYSAAHHIKTWIPKSVIKNVDWEVLLKRAEALQQAAKEHGIAILTETQKQSYEVEAIVSQAYILVKSDYKYKDLCKAIPNGKWHKEKKFWYYPYSIITSKAVVDAFQEVENKDIAQEIIDAANELVALQEIKTTNDLPDVPLEGRPAKNHQKQLFWFSKDLPGAGLLMDMGCMKTGVLIRLIDNSDDKKVLIICPDKVMRVWPKEYEKDGIGKFKIVPCEIQGKKLSMLKKLEIAKEAYGKYENVAIVINYDSVWRNPVYEDYIDKTGKKKKRLSHYEDFAGWVLDQHWDRIVLDESHRAKQHDGKTGKFIGELRKHAKKRNILTGTLIPHSPMDVFSQYLFLDPNVFGTNFYKFRSQYAVMGGWGGKQIVGYQNQDEMHEKIYSIAFRVTKDILDLPEEQHIIRDFDMNDEAWGYYQQANSELGIVLGEDRIRTDVVLVQLLRMQQITSGYLPVYREWYDDNDKLHHELDRVEKIDSGKAELLEEILDDIGEEPVVVFCRFQHDLDEIKAAAEKLGRTYGEISGRSKSALSDKAELQDNVQVAGVQIQAGGVGIDLTRARYGIYYSVGYSLGDYEQSLARIHRPGQEKPVIYYHLIASGTVDETVYSNLSSKRDVVKSIMESRE